jgi:hypothetical protein
LTNAPKTRDADNAASHVINVISDFFAI